MAGGAPLVLDGEVEVVGAACVLGEGFYDETLGEGGEGDGGAQAGL